MNTHFSELVECISVFVAILVNLNLGAIASAFNAHKVGKWVIRIKTPASEHLGQIDHIAADFKIEDLVWAIA